ncbi:cytochrome o ubiquinol oxidase subunit I [Candidatus Kaiserbacteria bacterium]|nr:cytochrome o ubiquinol oxidase subunit I [Candidatus Kaiserbacteria bacterium]
MFGKMSFAALPPNAIVLSAFLFMIALAGLIIGALFYYKRWRWLWDEWLTSLDAKKIGVMYIIVGFVMLVRGAIDAALMRGQQAVAAGDSLGYLSPEHFGQIFTAHGVIMIFFVAMPLMFGLFNLVVPMQIGARDVAFPFLNSLSFWLFAAAAVLMNISLVYGEFASIGWLGYPPLSELEYSPGVGVDYYIWILQIAGLGSLFSAINFLVTILKMRAPGMTLMRMPMFEWTTLASVVLVIVIFPILTATLAMLSLDRLLGMHFFTSDFGGNAMMYVNLIWAWGHPEVYVLILPAFGAFSEIVPTFAKKRLFGYSSMVAASIVICFLSFVVWLHHFFTMGAGANVNAFFGIATMVIAIPTGVKVFNWLATMYRGRITFTTPMYWFLGFVGTFTLGGMTGVMMAVPGIDFQMHNSLFLVAHFHNMVIGGVVFGYLAALSFWFPKIFGFTLDEKWGIRAFWCWLIGFFVAFMPLYLLGFMGATRRLEHYDASTGWQPLFIVAGIGVVIIALGIVFQAVQLVVSIIKRHEYADTTGDPWDGRTLEWSIPSPAPFYNFAIIPAVHGRDAFWEMKQSDPIVQARPAQEYVDIELPCNTPVGVYIGACAFVFGFAIVWHMWWLALLGFLGVVGLLIARSFDENTEYILPAAEIARLDAAYTQKTI